MSPSKDDLPIMISAIGLNTETGSSQQTGNTPSSSRQGTHVVRRLDFMIELVLHNSFSWAFQINMFKFDVSLGASLLSINIFLSFCCII
jgi:hypothetical protein